MIVRSTQLIAFSFLLFVSSALFAQSDNEGIRKDVEALQSLAKRLHDQHKKDSLEIERLKDRFGESVVMEIGEDGKITQLVGFNERGFPEFYETYNANAAATINTDDVHPGGGAGFNLTGAGIEIGEWDGGAVRATHQELTGRVTQVDGATTLSDHATHVAGTMIASGVQASAKGMAYEAELKAHSFSNDESEMATYAATDSAIVSNHSYGTITGWYYNSGAQAWYWYGEPSISQTEDYLFGFYNYWAYVWDTIANAAPNYLIVKSAGNDRNDNISASANDTHFVWSSGWTLSTQARAADCPTGYDCISTQGNAKNILTVGAVADIAAGYSQPSNVVMSSFSGWGPTDDGRIKPDIVGNGISLYSSGSASNTDYYNSSGTSMSAPNVTGSLALIQEYYEEQNSAFLRSSALKALVIHTANEAGNDDGPDYRFGWGLMDTRAAVEHLEDTNSIVTWDDLNNNDSLVYNYYFDGTEPIIATICWNDPAGTPVAASLDPTTSMLVNDLDLRVINDSSNIEYQPWILNPSSPANAATTGDNFRDNVEKVEIQNPDAGWYTFKITHKGSLVNPQEVSVVISRKADPPVGCLTTTSSLNPSICQGQTYTAPSGMMLMTTGVYSDTIMNAAGCDSVITINLTVSNPQVNIASSATGCSNASPNLTTSVAGGQAPFSYLWSTGSTNSSLLSVANGTYTVTVTDNIGCTDSETINVNTTIDNVPPTVVTQNVTLTLDATGNAALTVGQVDDGSTDNCAIASMSLDQTSFNCGDIGSNSVNLTVVDSAGNNASASATVTVEDNTAPQASASNATIYVDASGAASITAAQVDNGSTDNCGISTLSLSQTNFNCGNLGANSVTFTAEDASGNQASTTITITVVDTINPTVSGQSATVYLDNSGAVSVTAAMLSAAATDNCSVNSFTVSPNNFTCADLGVQNITLTANDVAGNSTNMIVQVTVVDTIAPSMSVVNTTLNLDASGMATLTGSSLLSNASDNCGVDSITVSQSLFDCNDIMVGGIPVTVMVYDGSGNIGQEVVNVQVVDNSVPTLSLQTTTIYLDENGSAGVTPSMVVDTAYDNCGISQLFVTPATFDCNAIGQASVTVFAYDENGNMTNESIQINVVDEMPPAVVGQSTTVYLNAQGEAVIDALDIENGSTDNCGVEAFSLSKYLFTCDDQGTSSTWLIVTDVNGNADSAEFEVVVMDTFNQVTGFVWSDGIVAGVDDSVRVDLQAGASYQWGANNGNIISQNNNEAVVSYTNGPNASVWVVQTAATGCVDKVVKKVKVWPLEVAEINGGSLGFKVFPNPTSVVLNIALEDGNAADLELLLYNTIGQRVYQERVGNLQRGTQHSISVPDLATGTYVLHLKHTQGEERFRILIE